MKFVEASSERGAAAGARAVGAILLAVLLAAACARVPQESVSEVRPIRVSDAVGEGDPARRASTRLVLQGLESDAAGQSERARGSYERAVQVDATNPYAYLALARHELDGDAAEPGEQVGYLIDQAAALFEAEGMREPRVGVHLLGLRGRAAHRSGQGESAELYLQRARDLSPEIWGDGYLSAEELR